MKTLILWLDAIRADYLAHMPFVNGLAKEWGWSRLKPPFGYCAAAGFFTGVGSSEHGQFAVYMKGVEGKSFYPWPFRLLPARSGFHAFNLYRYLQGKDMALLAVNPRCTMSM